MSLLNEVMEKCILLDKIRQDDGEGGFNTTWVESVSFDAAVIKDSTTLTQIAEQQGVTGVYTVTTDKSIVLQFPDTFKRASDGQVFRVQSKAGEVVTPPSSSLNISQVKAELWELPQ